MIDNQMSGGGFGNGSAAYTAIAVNSITRWRPEWQSTTRCHEAAEALLRHAEPGGRLETVWDTAVAIRACAGHDLHWSESALGFLIDDASRGESPTRLKSHHIAQLLVTIHELRPEELRRAACADWIREISSESLETTSAYSLGQVVWARSVLAINADSSARAQYDDLYQWLSSATVTKANFVEFCAALMGLGTSLRPNHKTYVSVRVGEIFSDGFRQDGSWYHDSWESSWALLALSSVSTIRKIEMGIHDLGDLFEAAETQADGLQATIDAKLLAFSHGSFLRISFYVSLATSMLFIVVLGSIFSPDWGWFLGLLGVVSAPSAFSVRQLLLERKRLS